MCVRACLCVRVRTADLYASGVVDSHTSHQCLQLLFLLLLLFVCSLLFLFQLFRCLYEIMYGTVSLKADSPVLFWVIASVSNVYKGGKFAKESGTYENTSEVHGEFFFLPFFKLLSNLHLFFLYLFLSSVFHIWCYSFFHLSLFFLSSYVSFLFLALLSFNGHSFCLAFLFVRFLFFFFASNILFLPLTLFFLCKEWISSNYICFLFFTWSSTIFPPCFSLIDMGSEKDKFRSWCKFSATCFFCLFVFFLETLYKLPFRGEGRQTRERK